MKLFEVIIGTAVVGVVATVAITIASALTANDTETKAIVYATGLGYHPVGVSCVMLECDVRVTELVAPILLECPPIFGCQAQQMRGAEFHSTSRRR